MNSEPTTMSVAEAKIQLTKMQDSLASIRGQGSAVDREYRAYLEVQIGTFEKAIKDFEGEK